MADPKDPADTAKEQRRAKEQRLKKLAAEKDFAKLRADSLEIQKKIEKSVRDEHRAYLDIYDKRTQELLRNEEALKQQEAALDKAEALLKIQLALDEPNQKQLEHLKLMVKNYTKAVEALRDQEKEAQNVKQTLTEMQAAAGHFAESLFGINERGRQLGKHFIDASGNVKLLNGSVSNLYKHLKQSVDKAGLLGSTLLKAYETAGKYHDKIKEFGKGITTDAFSAAEKYATDIRLTAQDVGYDIDQMNQEIVNRSKEITKGYNITEDEVRKTYTTLLRSSTRFKLASDEESKSIQRSATLMTRLGVEADTTGKIWNKLQTVFGKSAKESERLTLNVRTLARRLKMDTNQVAQQFLQTMDQLSVYALPRAEKEFARLTAVQRETGVEANKLMTAMDRWTTFEGAAEAAGTLNAAFGLNISQMEMLETATMRGPVEALILLKSKFDEAGVSVENMNFGHRRLVASIVGSGSVSDAMALLRTNTGKLRGAMDEAGGMGASLEEVQAKLNETTKKGSTLEQDAAKSIDERRKNLQKYADRWYDFQKDVQKWMAKSPWLAMIGGLVAASAMGIAKLIFLWRMWGAAATAEAIKVGAAMQAASGGGGPIGPRMAGGNFLSRAGGTAGASRLSRFGSGAARLGTAGAGAYLLSEQSEMEGGGMRGLARTGGLAGLGFSIAGPGGALVGGIAGAAWELIENKIEKDQGGEGSQTIQNYDKWRGLDSFQGGSGPFPTDVGLVDASTGRPMGLAHKGEHIGTKGGGGGGPLNLELKVELNLGDGVIIKGRTQSIKFLLGDQAFDEGVTKKVTTAMALN